LLWNLLNIKIIDLNKIIISFNKIKQLIIQINKIRSKLQLIDLKICSNSSTNIHSNHNKIFNIILTNNNNNISSSTQTNSLQIINNNNNSCNIQINSLQIILKIHILIIILYKILKIINKF